MEHQNSLNLPLTHTIHIHLAADNSITAIEVNHEPLEEIGDVHDFLAEPREEKQRIKGMTLENFIKEYMLFHKNSIQIN